MKKLLLILFFIVSTASFAQQKKGNTLIKNEVASSITNISAYPNPFSVSTKIRFNSTSEQSIEFSLKNLLGKTIFTQIYKAKKGFNSIKFSRNEFARGMYIYTLQTNTEVVSKRLIIR